MNTRQKALWLVLFLFPYYLLLKVPTLRVANPFYIGISLLFFVALFQIICAPGRYHWNILDFLLILFGTSFCLSSILGADPARGLYLGFRVIFIPIAGYFVIKAFSPNKETATSFGKAILFGTASFCILGLLLTGFSGNRGRILGQTPVGASNIALITFTMIMFSDYRKELWGKLSALAAVILIFLTFSRMSYLAVFLTLPTMVLVQRGHIIKLFVLLFPVHDFFLSSANE